jgi:hypothetical protein
VDALSIYNLLFEVDALCIFLNGIWNEDERKEREQSGLTSRGPNPSSIRFLTRLFSCSSFFCFVYRRKRHAVLICLAQIAEGCVKQMRKHTKTLVDMCMAGVQDPHGKVRWAACQALGQLCTDLGPDIQVRKG